MRYLILLSLVVFSISAAAQEQSPGEWNKTFVPEIMQTYFDNENIRTVIIPAGNEDPALKEAALSLSENLKRCKAVALIIKENLSKEILKLDDAAIINKVEKSLISHVFIIRYFSPIIVVTMYDKAGEAVFGFTAQKGIPITPRVNGVNHDTGVSARISDKVYSVIDVNERDKSPEEIYEEEYIGFTDKALLNKNKEPANAFLPFKGKNRILVSWETFYKKMNREDILTTTLKRKEAKFWLVVIGLPLGIISGLVAIPSLIVSASPEVSWTDGIGITTITTTTITALSTAAWITGLSMRANPSTVGDAVDMANNYNMKLRQKLGLPEKKEESNDATPMDWTILPYAGPTGGGIVLQVNF